MSELKPCPFCGCTAVLFENRGANNQMPLYGVTCMNCTARIYGYAKKDLAEEKWNKRVPQTVVNQHGENCTHISNCGTLNLKL